MSVTLNTNTMKYRETPSDNWAPLVVHADAEVDAVVQDTEPQGSENVWFDTSDESEVQVPTWDEFNDLKDSISSDNLAKTCLNGQQIKLYGQIISINVGAALAYFNLPFACTPSTVTLNKVELPGIVDITGSTSVGAISNGTMVLECSTFLSHLSEIVEATVTLNWGSNS